MADLIAADRFLSALRNNNFAGLNALKQLSSDAAIDSIDPTGGLNVDEIEALFTQLYDANNQQTLAYTNPAAAVENACRRASL